MVRTLVLVAGSLVLVAPLTAHALPLSINVISATCSTTVAARASWLPPISTTTTTCQSSQSLDEVNGLITDPDWADAHAFASVDYFATSTSSSSHQAFASSSADSLLTFAPLTDGIALLNINFENLSTYTNKSISLFDLTSQIMLWEQIWGRSGGRSSGSFGDLPTDDQGSVDVSTSFNAAHTYQLHLHSNGDSQGDRTRGSLGVSGLVAVPEPSSLFLLGTGLACVGIFRRARRSLDR